MVRHVPQVSVEEFVDGEEFTFDTVCAGGEILFENICSYRPRPLQAHSHEWVSPVTMALRDLDGRSCRGAARSAEAVLAALGFRDGFTHMEWYRKADGDAVFGEIGARPPGARTVDLMNYACDADLFPAGREAVTHGRSRSRSSAGTTPAASSSGPRAPAGSHVSRAWTGCWPSTATTCPRSTSSRSARRDGTGGPP